MAQQAPRRAPPAELMDGDGLSYEETARALDDLRRTNQRLLGYLPVVRSLLPGLGDGHLLLDLGSGSGDVAAAVEQAARQRAVGLRTLAVDRKLRHLVLGRRRHPEQLHVVASAEALPLAAGAVDWTFSSLFFHHFGGQENAAILAEMRRVSRRGILVVDLRRSLLLRWLIRPLLRLVCHTGPVATADGTASVQSAWSLDEVRHLVRAEPRARLRRRFPFRFALSLPPADSPDPAP